MAAARSNSYAGGFMRPDPSLSVALESARLGPPTESALLFAEDVAAMVGMTRKWVYIETRAGRIPHVALGRYYRYRPESIDAWLRQIEQRRA
jgi:excisionase family DNA binding protein